MTKKIKGLKKIKKFGIGKFIVMALVLGGGLIYGTQMVQKNQENRSNAAAPKQTCKCSKSGYDSSNLCSKAGGKWSCTITQPTVTPTKSTKAQKYYFYNGSKCVQTGDSYSTPSLCKGNVRSACYGSLKDCTSAHPTPTPTSLICSSSSCNGCKSVSDCNSVGCYWETAMKVCANSLSSCGSSPNTCKKGKVNSVENYRYYYIWKCGNDECRLEKPDALDVDTDSDCSIDRLGEQFCKNGYVYECKKNQNKYNWFKSNQCLDGCKNKLSLNNRTVECNECKTGDQYCRDSYDLGVCKDGQWSKLKCSYGCGGNKCKQCNSGDRRCGSKDVSISVIDVCENGFWKTVEECPNGCADTYCI